VVVVRSGEFVVRALFVSKCPKCEQKDGLGVKFLLRSSISSILARSVT